MNEKRFILVGGGARSGKSRFALSLAEKLGEKRLFIATAQARDEEMAARIRQHQDSRGTDFRRWRNPWHFPEALREIHDRDVVVIDCLTFWLANMLLDGTTSWR